MTIFQPAFLVGVGVFAYGAYRGYLDYVDQETKAPFDLEIPPVPLPNTKEELQSLHNRRVTIRGRFEHENEVLIGPRKNQQRSKELIPYWSTDGYYLLTPFILSDSGRRILVNRGWISMLRKDPVKRILSQVEGEIELNAYVTLYEKIDIITETRSSMQIEKWVYSEAQPKVDLESLGRRLNIEPSALFVADKYSTLKNGPIGGQIYIGEGEFRYMSTIAW